MSKGNKFLVLACFILVGLGFWAAWLGYKFESFNFLGAIAYFILVILVYRKSNIARYCSFAVLLVHAVLTFIIIASAVSIDRPSPEQLKQLGEGAHQVFSLEVDVKAVLIREFGILAAISICIYSLANNSVSKLFGSAHA